MRSSVRLTYVQHVLLDNGVHDDGHQHVEEDSGQVLDAMVEVVHGRLLGAFCRQSRHNDQDLKISSFIWQCAWTHPVQMSRRAALIQCRQVIHKFNNLNS